MSRPLSPRVSLGEMERRWQLVRSAMEAQSIDVLVAQGNSEHFGGYVRYLTDIAAFSGVATTVVFGREGGSTVLTHGPDADQSVSAADDGQYRGVSRVLTTPNYSSINYSGHDEQANVIKALAPYAPATIGLLGFQLISASTLEAIRTAHPRARIIDACDVIDPIRAIKSDEEQDLIRMTGALQDATMQRVFDEVKPGMKERDVSIRAQEIAMSLGSDQGVYMCGAAPRGGYAFPRPLREQHRVLAEGDMLHLLIECNGPGGYFTHMVRTAVLGRVPDRLKEEHEFALLAQKTTMDLMVPGALPREIREAHDAFMRAHGRPPENRVYCHSQGYDMMERPNVTAGETLPIHIDMNIGCHPSYAFDGMFVWVCNNYLLTDLGAEPVNKLCTEIFER